MHLSLVLTLSVVVLQPFCIASPLSLISTPASTLGKHSIFMSFVSNLKNSGNHIEEAKRSVDADAAGTPVGYSADGRCGPNHGGSMCDPDSTVYVGTCCSAEGWCGSTAEYCADGCVSGCFNRATPNQHGSMVTGRCGPSFGDRFCDSDGPYGGCCSSEGWCGSTFLYCDISEGCLSGCDNPASSFLVKPITHPNSRKTSSKSTSVVQLSSSLSNDGALQLTTTKSTLRSRPPPSRTSPSSTLSFQSGSANSRMALSSPVLDKGYSKISSQLHGDGSTVFVAISSTKGPYASQISGSITVKSSEKTISNAKSSTPSTPPTRSTSSTSKTHRSLASTSASPSSTRRSSNLPTLSQTPGSSILARISTFPLFHEPQSLSRPSPPSTSSFFNEIVTTSLTNSILPSFYTTSSTLIPPSIITIGGVAYTAIAPSTTLSTSLVPSVVTISGISYFIYENSQTIVPTTVGFSLSTSLATLSTSIPVSNPSSSSMSPRSSTISASPGTSASSSSLMLSALSTSLPSNVASTASSTRLEPGPLFSPLNAAQAACANPFESFPNGTNGLGLTVECFVTLDVTGYLRTWISENYPKVCADSQDFSTCFEEYLGIYDAGTDCTGIKTGSCTGFKYSAYAHMNWDVREIYILQSIYGINQFFASWYNGLLGAQSGAALTIGAIVNRLNPPKTTNVLLNDILAALSFGLSAFTLPDEIVKAVQGLEMIEDAIRATPGFVRAFAPEKTSNDQLQIGDIQAQLGAVVTQFLTQISNATAAIETNATAFTTWASTGLFIGNLVFLDHMVQDNYKYLNTFVLGQALNANNIVATVGLDTNVAQLQANSSDSLSYDIKCPSYDNNSMCNGWWYDAVEDATFALDDLNSMSKNMQDDLSYFFDSGWTNGTLLFEGALKCQQSGGGDPVLNLSPGNNLGAMAQCFSSVKLCTWNLGCDLDSQCEFKECPTQSGFGVDGCGSDGYAIYDFNVPYNYLGTFLTDANPISEVCNDGP